MDSTHKLLTAAFASLVIGAGTMVSLQAEAPSAQTPVESKKTKSVKKTAPKAKNDKAQENPTEEETEEEPTESTEAESETTAGSGGGGGGSGTGVTEPNAAPRTAEDTGVESSLDFAPHWRGFAAPHAANPQSRSQRSEASGKPGAKTSGSTPGSRKASTTSASGGNQGGNSSGGVFEIATGSTKTTIYGNNYWSGGSVTVIGAGNDTPANISGLGVTMTTNPHNNLVGLTRFLDSADTAWLDIRPGATTLRISSGGTAINLYNPAAYLDITPIGSGVTLTSLTPLTPQGSIHQWFIPTFSINGTSATQSYSSGTISSINPLPVPEPSSAILLGSVALLATRRRRSN